MMGSKSDAWNRITDCFLMENKKEFNKVYSELKDYAETESKKNAIEEARKYLINNWNGIVIYNQEGNAYFKSFQSLCAETSYTTSSTPAPLKFYECVWQPFVRLHHCPDKVSLVEVEGTVPIALAQAAPTHHSTPHSWRFSSSADASLCRTADRWVLQIQTGYGNLDS